MAGLTLYTKSDCHELMSPSMTREMSHILSLLSHDVGSYISNVKTEIVALVGEHQAWAVTVNAKEYKNALICSPYTTYVKYPIKKYPKHAINFYRVNNILDHDFFKNLQKNDYCVFPDRISHIFFKNSNYIKRSHTKRDISLLRNSSYEIVPHEKLTDADANRICQLYQMLFINKHSKFNPAYTSRYFCQAIREHWHHYTAFRNSQGQIDAFISWFYSENVMLCGPLGYHTEIPVKVGLYRQLVALCLQHAYDHDMTFNMGGGSSQFKLKRGSVETLEWTAVYYRHLSFYRKIPWRILSWAFHHLLQKILKTEK